jgi:DNA gyrase subunit B
MKDDDVPVLRELDPIRKRPGMYVGGTDATGVHHLLWEVVGNVVDLHLARFATELHVDVADDGWVVVRDDGPGISTDLYPGTQASTLEIVFTKVTPAGQTSQRLTPHVHLTPTLRGVGVGVVNALSMRTEVETTRAGKRWVMAFERGRVATPLRSLGATTVEGTTIRFRPDPQIFTSTEIDLEQVRAHLQQVAWLSPLLRVFLQGRRISGRGGLRGWAELLAGRTPDASFSTEQKVDAVYVDLALAWRGNREPIIHSFVNMQSTRGHGTHVQGLDRAFAACAKDLGVSHKVFRARVEPGLIAMIHVGLFDPRWGNPTKDQLLSPVAGEVVEQVLGEELVVAKSLRTFFERRLRRRRARPATRARAASGKAVP